MDRIDSMDAKEKDAALRELIKASRDVISVAAFYGGSRDALLRALAAFDPTPLDRARKLLEDGGFVKVGIESESKRRVWLTGIGQIGDYYELPKEQP